MRTIVTLTPLSHIHNYLKRSVGGVTMELLLAPPSSALRVGGRGEGGGVAANVFSF